MALLRKLSLAFVHLLVSCTALDPGLRGDYVITYPHELAMGSKQNICFTFHKISKYAAVNISLEMNHKIIYFKTMLPKDLTSCVSVEVPYVSQEERFPLSLNIFMEKHKTNTTSDFYLPVHALNFMLTLKDSLITLVQTDKPIYKPGQMVKFRILTLDTHLKPWKEKIEKVQIKDPNDVVIQQWKDVSAPHGLVSLEMELAAEPTLGNWYIHVLAANKKIKAKFSVDKYVLPKFEIILKPPSYILIDAKEIEVGVCARYVYGKPVSGRIYAKVCIKSEYSYGTRQRPCYIHVDEIHGCETLHINSSFLHLNDINYSSSREQLIVYAEVTEYGTEVKMGKNHTGPRILRERFKIDIASYTNSYFKPGFPVLGKLRVYNHDGSPVPNQLMNVIGYGDSKLHGNPSNMQRYKSNLKTDEDGFIRFRIPPLQDHYFSYSFEVSNPQEEVYQDDNFDHHWMYDSRAYLKMKQWNSPSSSYIWTKPVYDKLKCGSSIMLHSYYIRNLGEKIHYQIISRGSIVDVGSWLDTTKYNSELPSFEEYKLLERHVATTTQHPTSTTITTTTTTTTKTMAQTTAATLGERFTDVFSIDIDTEKVHSLENKIDPSLPVHPKKELETEPLLPVNELPEQEQKNTESEQKEMKNSNINHYILNITISPEWSPGIKILFYYVRENIEIVTDFISLEVEDCLNNQVTMGFKESKLKPGSTAKLSLRASPHSFCGISMVDKSVNVMGGENQITPYKLSEILKLSELGENHDFSDRLHCKKVRDSFIRPGPPGFDRVKKSYVYNEYMFSSKYLDSSYAFKKTGLSVISNLLFETRQCECAHLVPLRYQYPTDSGKFGPVGPALSLSRTVQPIALKRMKLKSGSGEEDASIRSYFPETWLWELETIGDDGKLELERELPHTITEWVGNSLCTNSETGVGVSPPASITAFQPFFVSYTLPYSAIRGEIIPLKVTIFNYLKDCLIIEHKLIQTDEFEIAEKSEDNICVCGSDSKVVTYHIVPLALGKIDIDVTAEAIGDNGICGNKLYASEALGAHDSVSRKLLVEPEGIEEEYTVSSFFCPNESYGIYKETFNLHLPEKHLVPDSARGYVSVIGDLLGSSLSNLEHLVQKPYGCGEQNMVGFVPNIFVLQYLLNTKQDEPNLLKLAKQYMVRGYQRELQFMHADGSFSAFGMKDQAGSTWLTAFVLRSFAQASPYIFIDPTMLEKIKSWFYHKQLETGCFREYGHVWSQYMKGGGADDSGEISLTAYSLIALLEAGERNSSVISAAACCLERNVLFNTSSLALVDIYTLSLITYAFSLYNHTSEKFQKLLQDLLHRKKSEDELEYWTRFHRQENSSQGHHQAPAAEVEITAYALMSLLNVEHKKNAGTVLPIIRWLTKQRNAHGGFSSTQDTVLALQALAQFAEIIYTSEKDLKVAVSGRGFHEMFEINQHNSIVLQSKRISQLPNNMEVEAQGSGCCLMQMNVKYNVDNLDDSATPFTLDVNVYNAGDCKFAKLEVCSQYRLAGISNMAVVEIKMPTGWEPSGTSYLLQNTFKDQIKRKEITNENTQVNVYFEEMGKSYLCFVLKIEEKIRVGDLRPAVVRIYDYYESSNKVVTKYALPDCPQMMPKVKTETSEHETLKPGHYGKSQVCPVCFAKIPADFEDRFCKALAVYIVYTPYANKIKVRANIRHSPKKQVSLYVNLHFTPDCLCHVPLNKRFLVLTTPEAIERNKKVLHIDHRATVVLIKNKHVMKEVLSIKRICGKNL